MCEKKVVDRRIAITLGIICLILLIGLVEAIMNYTSIINNKDNTIQTLTTQNNQLQTWQEGNITYYNSQLSSLNSQITNLQNQISSLNAQIANLQNQIGLLNDIVIHVDGITLLDAFGNEVYLKSINVHRNYRRSENGRLWSIDDVKQMKEAGANCLEIHVELIHDWMPERNQINETYFINWLDKEVNWCTQYEMYCIINICNFRGSYDWSRQEPFLPDWLWEGLGYSEPTNKELADIIIRDFFDTDVQKQEINREAFINAWKFVANRYKNNKYVLFNIMNEPLCGVELINSTISIHLGITYARFMERVIDAIRSTGAKQVIFVDRPYVWYLSHVQPINRDNIVWEDHSYVTQNTNINAWKDYLDTTVQRFVHDFGKPLFIGEYGTNDPVKPSDWRYILSEEVAYLKTKTICGRQWHTWGWIDSEYFNAEESEWIIRTVLG